MLTAEFHRSLVDRLVSDAKPVRRPWPVALRFGLWSVFGAALFAILVWASPRPDIAYQIRAPLFQAQVVILIAAAYLAALLALRLAIPGHETSLAAFLATAILTVAVPLSVLVMPAHGASSLEQFVTAGAPCTVSTFAIAAVPCFALLLALRRGAPLAPVTAGALAGAAAMFLAAAAMRVLCPNEEPLHILAWHLSPVAVGVAMSGVVALAWLPRWRQG